MKIATFNANSLRSRLDIVLSWLSSENPDVLAIQETKVQDADFPEAAIVDAGWKVIFRGQKSYNGVAFVFKKNLERVCDRLYPQDADEPARFLHAKLGDVHLINTYVPQGHLIDSPKFQYKLQFFRDLEEYFRKNISSKTQALWMGDLNVAPTELDLARPKENADHVCFHPQARAALASTMGQLWVDLFRQKELGAGHYTFWDYRQPNCFARNLGWRIDHILGTPPMSEQLKKIWIDKAPRALDKPSDHTFLVAEF